MQTWNSCIWLGLLLWFGGVWFVSGVSSNNNNNNKNNKNEMSYKDEADGNKIKHFNPNDNFHLKIRNLSQYRVDVYWDDGMYGNLVGTMNVGDDDLQVNTFLNHGFFVTRHGTKDILYEEGEEEQERIRLIASHPNQILEIALDVGPSNDPCRDRFTMCPTEAKKGSCLTAPGWMIVHCCESCQSDLNSRELIDVNKRCSREHLNVTEPIWKPGDLNKLFEHWATDPSFAPYEPKVWSSPDPQKYGGADGPWIVTFDNFITDLEVADVIHGGHISGFERSTDQGAVAKNTGEQEKVVSKTRTSSNAWCRGECERLPGVKSLTAKIERFTQVPHRHFESYQILDYEPNQFYRSHHDSARRDLTMSGPRIMTFFLYLSDVEEGGETRFTSLNISVKPKKGRALIWPSVTDDDPGYWDDRTYHEAKAVIKGKKYAANHWIHLYDFVTPNEWGCTGGFA